MFKIYAMLWGNLYEEPWEIGEYDTYAEATMQREKTADAFPEWYVWIEMVD